MKTVYANYVMLVSFEVEDDTTEEEMGEMVDDEMIKHCGLSIYDFDDGEWDAV